MVFVSNKAQNKNVWYMYQLEGCDKKYKTKLNNNKTRGTGK